MTDRYKNFNLALFANFALFNPKGWIASEQKELIITATMLMLMAVIPVLVITFVFAWKYRAGNNAKYAPTFDHSRLLQFTWWTALCAIIVVLSVIAWKSSYALDPRKTLKSNIKPITIQVVALEWKWLFIYPEQNIATVNFMQFPEDTPINFEITADAPMNSFWIPQLGGQMYAMSGMKTKLHLEASDPGTYRGLSSNISGEGFAGINFTAVASSNADFDTWVRTVKQSSNILNLNEYDKLAEPSKNNPVTLYSFVEDNLLDTIIMKFMMPQEAHK